MDEKNDALNNLINAQDEPKDSPETDNIPKELAEDLLEREQDGGALTEGQNGACLENDDVNYEMYFAKDDKPNLPTQAEELPVPKVAKDKNSDAMQKSKRVLAKVAIALGACLVLAVVVVLMFYFIPTGKDKQGEEEKYSFTRQVYCYVVALNDESGVTLDSSWMLGTNPNIFTIEYDATKITMDGGVVKICDDFKNNYISDETETVINYIYNKEVVAIFNLKIVKSANFINSYEDLIAIPAASSELYIQKSDIDLSAKRVHISNFHGGYYGNHYKISNFSASEGGLFDVAHGAEILSVTLSNVSGYMIPADLVKAGTGGVENSVPSFGCLVNYAYSTDISYCSVSGEVTIASDDSVGSVNIGGMVGYFDDSERRSDADYNVNSACYCTAGLTLKVTCKYSVDVDEDEICIGLLIGNVYNASVNNSECAGRLEATVTNAEEVCIGGLIGKLIKESANFGTSRIHNYEMLQGLYSSAEVAVEIGGDNEVFTTYCGGDVGYAENVNFTNLAFSGSINIKSGKANLATGGIFGGIDNHHSFDMWATKIGETGTLKVESTGKVLNYEIAGYASDKVTFEKDN